MKRNRTLAWTGLAIILATCLSVIVAAGRVRTSGAGDDLPLAVVKRGDVDLKVFATGELRASHAMMLSAPAIGGDALQITRLTRTGEAVKKGDVVIEFDPSEQRYKIEESRSELLQAEQEITKAKADATVLAAQDKVSLLKDRYAVRSAELDVQKNELLSKIDADKNILALQQAKRVLGELEKDILSHKQSGQAATYLAQEKYNKAKLELDEAQSNLDKMRVTAPMDGLVSIQKNINASGGFFFTGMTLPDYHPGDQVQPGSAVAQVVDPLGMDLTSHISEEDRDNIRVGEPALVTFDALPGVQFQGTVKNVSGMSVRQFFEANNGGNFDVAVQLDRLDPRLRSGFTAQIVFLAGVHKNVLYLPRLALFLKDGKRIVYVKNGSGYEQRDVKIENESESRAIIEGLEPGEHVALIDPTAPRKTGGSAAGSTGGSL
ncbi:MAG TPA: HlyD family efflux transporter periplasmic adaptor subunit [Terracidiphilus sp.]|nr:HlyD family efflux transporter periplasmic adaptor subunit [Terracidiphilus sp.]